MRHFINLLIISLTFSYYSQNIFELPYIEVNGNAEIEIIPDEIYISITIRERIENKERITLDIQEKNVKELLKKINIDINKLSLEDANSDYIKIKIKQKDVLSQITYSLKLSNAKEVNDLFTGLYEIKIYDAYISKVYHSKMEDFKRELRIKAIKDAKDKALYLSSALGNQIGKTLVINESYPIVYDGLTSMDYRPKRLETMPMSESSIMPNESQEMNFKKIKLQSSIYTKFELK